MARSLRLTVDELCEAVYTLVQKRLYCNLVRILLDTEYNLFRGNMPDAQISSLIEKSFQSALEGKTDFFSAGFFSDAVLIGIGAPVHLLRRFLLRCCPDRDRCSGSPLSCRIYHSN